MNAFFCTAGSCAQILSYSEALGTCSNLGVAVALNGDGSTLLSGDVGYGGCSTGTGGRVCAWALALPSRSESSSATTSPSDTQTASTTKSSTRSPSDTLSPTTTPSMTYSMRPTESQTPTRSFSETQALSATLSQTLTAPSQSQAVLISPSFSPSSTPLLPSGSQSIAGTSSPSLSNGPTDSSSAIPPALHPGAIAGIVIGVLLFAAGVFAGVAIVCGCCQCQVCGAASRRRIVKRQKKSGTDEVVLRW